jgi:hypothetical protein
MRFKKVPKKAQEVKISGKNFPKLTSKKAQEEIIGFGIILLLIAVIGIVFLSISINKNSQKQEVEDYESQSFLKAMLETTTECEKESRYLSVKDLAFECQRNYLCYNEEHSCTVLNDSLKGILDGSWEVGIDTPIKGYGLLIESEEEKMINVTKGVVTNSYKGASQNYAKSTDEINFYFKIYI